MSAESPRTEAGRKLVDQGAPLGSTREWFAQDILAIEAEAVTLSDSALPSLDAAWKAAEAALPNERWRIGAVKRLNDGYWRAYAEGPIREGWTKSADGPTPTTALLNLATALTKP